MSRVRKDLVGGRGGAWETWTLVEALNFPDTPMTVMSVGGKMKEWATPARYLGARTVELLANIHRGLPDSSEPDGKAPHSILMDSTTGAKTVICPIMGPFGKPHGYRVWMGEANADPGPPPPAAGFTWDREVYGAYETFECAAMSGTSREKFQALCPVSDFTRRGVTFDMATELVQFAYNLEPTSRFVTDFSVMHIVTGAIMPWMMAMRPINPTQANGIFYDFTPLGVEPRLPSDAELGMREFAEGADRYLALVAVVIDERDTPEMVLCSWITQPPPWVKYDDGQGGGTKYLHPADRREFCQHWAPVAVAAMTSPPVPGKKLERFPFRFAGWGPEGEWVSVTAALRPYARGTLGLVDNLFVMEVAQEQ